ncbi:DUF2164 domain-containing protein [Uliginosibacterium paludis]|jgi:uncharacterized protein (DUF2164 family)|uniref:DUF2164 domain-containing protein n=1 Tax=Uliginosibacterium paludis TaxID=1615952 RepID=A0ABV2CP29_9RHOO
MAIELDKQTREEAIASLQRYFRENMEEPLGNIGAGALLGFFIEEIGPAIYNQGVADAQARMLARVEDLDIEVHEEGFRYWRKYDEAAPGRGKR